jgi:hypothetical protein
MSLTDRQRDRLMAKIEVSSDGSWKWMGSVNSSGYGNATVSGRTSYVHKLLWEDRNGSVPLGHKLFSKTGVSLDVNPDSWEALPYG